MTDDKKPTDEKVTFNTTIDPEFAEKTETAVAAARRADYVRALEEEKAGYLVHGKTDRAAEVDEQLKFARGKGKSPKVTTEDSTPVETREA